MAAKDLIELINNGAPFDDIKNLVESGIDLDEPGGKMGLCSLHQAVYANRVECVLCLVKQGCNINVQDQCGFTPLHVAVKYKRVDVMKELLQLGANLDTEDAVGCPALNIALQKGYEECAEALLEKGANPNKYYKHVGYEIHGIPSNTPKCLELLLQHGADPELRNSRGLTALHIAVKGGNILYVYSLLQHGANPKATYVRNDDSQNKWTALHLAAIGGERGIAELLLLYGAQVNTQDVHGNSAMHLVAAHDQLDIAQLLIQHGALVTLENERKYQPLHRACASATNTKLLTLLLENGANVNARTIMMETPLKLLLTHIAKLSKSVLSDCRERILVLINYGAYVTLTTDNNDTFNVKSILESLSLHHLPLIKLLLDVADRIFITSDEADILRGLDEHLRECILMLSRNPRTLKHLARKTIRRLLRVICDKRLVNSLEIPGSLKDYLRFE